MEGTGWGFLVGTVKTIVAIISVPAWCLSALMRWHPRRTWFAACLCAVAAGSFVTVIPALFHRGVPSSWYFT